MPSFCPREALYKRQGNHCSAVSNVILSSASFPPVKQLHSSRQNLQIILSCRLSHSTSASPRPTHIDHISLQPNPLSRIQIQPKSQACAKTLSHTGVAAVFAPATGPYARLLLVRNATSPQPNWSRSRVLCVLGVRKRFWRCRRLNAFRRCCGIMSRRVDGTG